MIAQLRQTLQALQRPSGIDSDPGCQPLGIAAIDGALGGGLMRGALHEIAAAGEAHLTAAAGFALAVSSRAANSSSPLPWGKVGSRSDPGEGLRTIESHLPSLPPGERDSRHIRGMASASCRGCTVWIAEDMALAENGAPYGPGFESFGVKPERLLTVAAARTRDLLWAMEEALRCRTVGVAIGELRHGEIDTVAVRRLSLAAAESGALALLLRASPPHDASTAATRWIVGSAPNDSFAVKLTRNRRGPLGVWILQWSDEDERFVLAAPAQPVAAPAADRPHRKIA